MAESSPPRIVIIGAGFGGIQAALGLRKAEAEITIIDRWNHHLFQPLLYQVATAGLSPAEIATPIRNIVRKQKNTQVLMEEVTGIDREARLVIARDMRIPFDYLVVATGSETSYFGHTEWSRFAHGLKSIEDARLIREEILSAFEDAEEEPDAQKRKQLLTFVVIGGGPTGVEMAGAIAELGRVVREEYRNIDTASSRILLVEASPRVLGTFDKSLSEHAHDDLRKLGVEVQLGKKVTAIDKHSVTLENETIESSTIIWAAGVRASKAAEWLGAKADKMGRAIVTPSLTLDDDDRIYIIGDTAYVEGKDGKPLPGLSPVAMQQGRYVAKAILAQLKGEQHAKPFRYWNKGVMATIGRSRAIAEIGNFKFTGILAWLLWTFIHIFYLIGFRNRLVVMFEWIWAYVTFQRGVRIISSKNVSKK